MNWYKTAQEYTDIAHQNYILWFSKDDGRIVTSEPQKKPKNTNKGLYHSNWEEWRNDSSSAPYRGRYDTVRKIVTIIGPGFEDAPQNILNGLMRTFPDAKTSYVFDSYNTHKTIRLAGKSYLEIGHGIHDAQYNLWYSPDGSRIVKTKPNEFDRHNIWRRVQPFEGSAPFSGRYDIGTKEISVVGKGYKSPPQGLLNNLLSEFPDAKTLYIYTDFQGEPEIIRVASKITAQLRGEWWIIDGKAIFADGDTGDIGHEGYVIDSVQRKYAYDEFDKGEWIDWDAFKMQLASESYEEQFGTKLNTKFHSKEVESLAYKKLMEMGMTDEEYRIADGRGDARQYGMEHLGWKRVAGRDVQTQTLTHDDLKSIASGLGDAYGDDGLEDRTLFNIAVNATGAFYSEVPYYLISDGSPSQIVQYNTNVAYANERNWYRTSVKKIMLSPEVYEQLEEMANKMAKGYRNWTLDDLQLQSNYPEAFEWFLRRLKDKVEA